MDPCDFEVEVKLIIKAKNTEEHTPALGKGIVSLCKLVDETGSLNKAAAEMGMAYSKAWSILKHAEESFDIQLLRRKGNKGSELTPEARSLIAIYEELQKQLDEQAANLLQELLR